MSTLTKIRDLLLARLKGGDTGAAGLLLQLLKDHPELNEPRSPTSYFVNLTDPSGEKFVTITVPSSCVTPVFE